MVTKKAFPILILFFAFYFVEAQTNSSPYIQILGIAQDAGYPQMGCTQKCCIMALENDSLKKSVVSLALIDPTAKKWWLFEATPDIKQQLQYFKKLTKGEYPYLPEGIFLTHAHIGHYTGIMQLGREVMNTNVITVYVLPKMKTFLETNGPWAQLVSQKNIFLNKLSVDTILKLNESISVSTFTVPHRDEFSETAGFKIITSAKKYLFIPDIDKWEKWNKSIVKEVESAEYALLDATFYEVSELKNRKISEVPHPLVGETMQLFLKSSAETRSKIVFIHFNHTNPLMWDKEMQLKIKNIGFKIASQGDKLQ